MSDEKTVEVGPNEDPGVDDLVPVEDATDEELEKFLENDPPAEDDAETQPTVEQPKTEPGNDQPPKDGSEPAPAQSPVDVAKLQAQLRQQEEFIKQRNVELGRLRAENRQHIAQLEAQAKEAEDVNPREAARLDREIEAARAKERELAGDQEEVAQIHEALTIVPKYVRAEEFDISAIATELREDGMPEAFIERFQKNPFGSTQAETLIHLAKRSHYAKALRQLIPTTRALFEENKKLHAQLKNKGITVAQGINRALKAPAPLTASASATASTERTPAVDPTSMSDAELEAYLRKAG